MAEGGAPGKDDLPGFGGLLKKDREGNTPLHLAALTGNADVIRTLLEIDKEALEERNELGQTPLYLAAISGDEEAVGSLLEAGADIGTVADDGSTIWHAAALAGGGHMVKLLADTAKIASNKNIHDEAEDRYFLYTEGGEFDNFITTKTTDKSKLENDCRDIIENQNDSTSLDDRKRNAQIKNVNEVLEEHMLPPNYSGKSIENHECSEKRIPSAWEKIYQRANEIELSSESELDDMFNSFNSFKENEFSPPFNIDNAKDDSHCFDFDEDYDTDYESLPKYSINDIDQEFQETKLRNISCNNAKYVHKQNAGDYEEIIHASPENEKKVVDNKNTIIDNNYLAKNMSKSKKKRERRKKSKLFKQNSGQLKEDVNTIASDKEGSEREEGTIFIDLTRNGRREGSPERDSSSQPRYMKNSQRRNKNRRKNNQRKESMYNEIGEREEKMKCSTFMEMAYCFIRNNLLFVDLMLGPSKDEKTERERMHNCMRKFFENHVETEVDVSSTDGDGRTLLHHASAAGAVGTVQRLLRAGANVNLPDNAKATPMLLAALGGSAEVVGLLAQSGGKVDVACTATGESPLHIAAKYDYHQTVRKLLELGADPNVEDLARRTPLEVALSKGYTASGVMLMKHGASLRPKSASRRW